MKMLPRKVLEKVAAYTPGKPVEEVQRELGVSRVIKLASNENALGPSPKALEAMKKGLSNLHRYPDSHCYALIQRLSRHWEVAPEELIVGNGSDELITLAVHAFLDPGDEVVIADPTFLIYRIASQIAGASIRLVPLKDFRYDLKGMRKAITPKTKIVFIANPDNPTGTYVTQAEVESFLEGLPEGVLLFFDEAYAELVDAPDYPDTRAFLRRHPILITRSFSKAYGLAGIRVGYGMAEAGIIQALHRVREPFNVNALAQAAALAALDDAEHLEKTRQLLRQEKPVLLAGLKSLGLTPVPSVTNFILFSAGPKAPQVAQELLKRGVIVREMTAWNLSGNLRVTVGLPEENQAFLIALKEVLK